MEALSPEFSDLFFQSAPVGLNLCRMDGVWVESNPAFLRMIGYSKEEADGGKLTYWQLTPRKYDDQEQVQLESLRRTQKYGPYEKEFIRKDGTLIPVRLNGFIIEKDGAEYIWSIIEDLTDVRALEAKVGESQTFLNAIIENIPLAVFVKDVNDQFKIKLWNKTAEDIFQIPRSEIIGKTAHDLWPDEEADLYLAADEKVARDGVLVDVPIEPSATKSRGTIYLHTRKLPLRLTFENKIDALLCISEDITRELAAQAALISTQKLAALGEMAAGLAHEVNNPLMIIKGSAEILRHQIAKGDFKTEAGSAALSVSLDSINNGIDRISKLVKGLGSFSRNADEDPFLAASLQQIIDDSIELCRMRLRKANVDLKLESIPPLQLNCRANQVSQILVNLINNACDAVQSLTDRWIIIAARETNQDFVEISVTDSGAGIPAKTADSMMQPFFTTKEVGKGTGLGLSISLGIAQDHGGALLFDRQSKNTRFVLRLPLQQM